MNRALRVLGLAAVLAAPTALSAQAASRPISFGVSGGLSMPMGDLSDGANSGFVIAGHVYFAPASLTAIRFRGDVAYDKWGAKGADELEEVGGDADFRSLSFVANAIYDVGSSSSGVRPYLLGGLGLYNSKFSLDLGEFGDGSVSSTDLGIQVGGGLTFKLSGFDTFVEAKYVNVFGDGSTNWIPISFGVRF